MGRRWHSSDGKSWHASREMVILAEPVRDGPSIASARGPTSECDMAAALAPRKVSVTLLTDRKRILPS
jgi:hypothetical protein